MDPAPIMLAPARTAGLYCTQQQIRIHIVHDTHSEVGAEGPGLAGLGTVCSLSPEPARVGTMPTVTRQHNPPSQN